MQLFPQNMEIIAYFHIVSNGKLNPAIAGKNFPNGPLLKMTMATILNAYPAKIS